MRRLMISLGVVALTTWSAVPAHAQSGGVTEPRAYVSGMAGFTSSFGSTTSTTGDVIVEGGARVMPHLMLFADVGQLHNLKSDLQPTLNSTTATSANQGLSIIGSGTLPARYTLGGVRFDVPTHSRFTPYVLGGVGVARLNPTAQFAFSSGTMPDGSTPIVGQDVTSTIATAGFYAAPPSSTAFMYTVGGGVQVPVAPRWVVDAGYRFSRIAADSTLSAQPLDTQGMTFGFGYRF